MAVGRSVSRPALARPGPRATAAVERLRGHTEALAATGVAHDPALVRMELHDADVIAQDARSVGRAAADVLIARLDGDDGPTRAVVVPTTRVARASGEIPPGGVR
jgi:LacI family transcriptional regulator